MAVYNSVQLDLCKKNSYKATSQGAKSGHEKSVTTKILFSGMRQ